MHDDAKKFEEVLERLKKLVPELLSLGSGLTTPEVSIDPLANPEGVSPGPSVPFAGYVVNPGALPLQAQLNTVSGGGVVTPVGGPVPLAPSGDHWTVNFNLTASTPNYMLFVYLGTSPMTPAASQKLFFGTTP
jgi:hypothetical protein